MLMPSEAQKLRKTVVISMFASVAVVLGVVESLIPFAVSLPGAKLGLGNIIVLTCLVFFTARDAWTLIMLKTIITSFIFGSFSTFLFSLFGAALSFAFMFLMLRLGKDQFSLTGVSIVGGIMHNLGQLAAASIVLGTTSILYYLPFLLVSGVVTGIIVGFATRYLVDALSKLSIMDLTSEVGK